MRIFLVATVACICLSTIYAAPTEKEETKVVAKVEEKVDEAKSAEKAEAREGKSLKQGNVFLASNQHTNAAGPAYHQEPYQPGYGAFQTDPLETAIGYVYYYLPTAENYMPKYETMKKFSPLVKRAMPIMKRMYADASESMGEWGLRMLERFTGMASSFGQRVSQIGRKRRDVDDNEIDAPLFVEHDGMMSLARQVDKYLMMYIRAFMEPSCIDKFMCEGGDITSRLGGTIAKPLLRLVEPFLPEYMKPYADSFKRGFRDRSACSRSSCSVETFF